MRKRLKKRRGEGYIDVCVLVVCAMLVIAFALRVLPVFIAKQQLDTYATELVREAEISGRVGSETTLREQVLNERMGITPEVEWSQTGNIQLNHEVTVTVRLDADIGLFGDFGSFPISLTAQATGKSEVYHK
ncbi:MAG: DUF4320 family protein [Oscillospiraceae bacterium]